MYVLAAAAAAGGRLFTDGSGAHQRSHMHAVCFFVVEI